MSKLFKLLFFTSFIFLSCTKIRGNVVVIKAGDKEWTVKEIRNYFHLRVNKAFSEGQKPEDLKKELLNEILLRSVVENWGRQNQIQIEPISLTEEEKKSFPKYSVRRRALKDHKSYLSLYNLLLKNFFKKTPKPSLKEQKNFYNKNKDRFVEPATCRLKQILVEKKQLAQSLLNRLKQGENFDTLNQLYSLKKNPGWVKKGDLDIFDKACFDSPKPLSSVLKSPYGYHIFLVEEKRFRRQKNFQSVQRQILQNLKTKGAKEQFQIWLKQEIFKTPLFIDKNLLDKIHIQYKKSE